MWVMIEYLYLGRFKWLNQNQIDEINVNTIQKDNPECCKSQVDFG